MEIKTTTQYELINKLEAGKTIKLNNTTYMLTERKELIELTTGKYLPYGSDETYEIDPNSLFVKIPFNDLFRGQWFIVDGCEGIFMCTNEESCIEITTGILLYKDAFTSAGEDDVEVKVIPSRCITILFEGFKDALPL